MWNIEKTQAGFIIGDVLALSLVTVSGFVRHNPLAGAGEGFMATLFPLILTWLLAVSLAAWLRGTWSGSPILPTFIAVITGIAWGILFLWRGVFAGVRSGKKSYHG